MRGGKLPNLLEETGLVESSALFSNDLLLLSYITESIQIDAIWISPNLKPSKLSIIPHYFEMGDHRVFIANFPIEYFIREGFVLIMKSDMRRLTSTQPQAMQNYLSIVRNLQKEYKIELKL